ncbi:homoserine O-acetyltransferase [Longibacter salinarum]|uniref:Homoserine O-acetyltransferase n=1 Tax=Longibacter salinarum TaxID=1850348 RepID=A0A2A8D200_9BACT|nr:homoserine O-acetyltransferase [Longibacter salinarum]PEN14668.1 homoserine O-acetyltransferase [Longibacter salinarum]
MSSRTFDRHGLESGAVLKDAIVEYETWGTLNEAGTNAIVVCHALTGDAHADDWWEHLIGPGRPIDTDRYFVVCANTIGSPYGTASPLSLNPDTGERYGATFPQATVRDTVRLHHRLLWSLGVRRVAAVVGGSMGGMQVLEWAVSGSFVQTIVPIAVGGRHSPWQIGWSEAQRQAIMADPNWNGGQYTDDARPSRGLSAARMMAMVSYRSRGSFEQRFGRRLQSNNGSSSADAAPFEVESYLRYQGRKLDDRFDANCYVHLTRQMDSHDISRGRGAYEDVLASIEQPALVIGISSDVLYPVEEQEELASLLPNASLHVVDSPHGHDGFLIEQDAIAEVLHPWLETHSRPSAQGASTFSVEANVSSVPRAPLSKSSTSGS